MLEFIHYLHVVSAVTYGGSVVLFGWVVAPALYRMEPDARAEHFAALEKLAAPVVAGSAILAVLTGVIRVWLSGAVGSFGDLFSGYGLMATLAVAVIVVWQAIDTPGRARMSKAVANRDTDTFGREYRRSRTLDALALLIILGLMVSMRMGLY